jgi:acetyl-CoA acetyltransferase
MSCASGTIAVGEAFHAIRAGRADVMVAGGAEAPLAADPMEARDVANAHPIVVATLEQLQRGNRRDGAPDTASNGPRIELDHLAPNVRENLRALGYLE